MRLIDEFDRDILHYAFRYALGRRSYSVGIVIDELKRNWNDLCPFDRKLVKKEIREAIRQWTEMPYFGGFPFMPADIVQDWEQILTWED